MRRLALTIAATLAAPAGALAAESGPGLAGSLVQMVGSLVLVIGIILILYYLAGRFLKLSRPQGGAGYIRVVETRHLAPKKSLMLVEVAGEYLLLSNSGESVTLIKQVEMLEEIEVVDEASPAKAALAAAAGQCYATLIPPRLKKGIEGCAGGIPALARLGQFKKSGGFA
jgi:flagellar protein FliO/FliZ